MKRGHTIVLVASACLVTGCTTGSTGGSNASQSTTTRLTGAQSQLTATQIDCHQFSQGSAQTLEHLVYASKGGQITGVTPFQFYYWVKVTASSGLNRVVINQSIQGPAKPLVIGVVNGVYALTTGSCVRMSNTTAQNRLTGGVSVTFNESGAGATPVYIEANFGSASLIGDPVPSPQRKVEFHFSVRNASSSIDLISD